MSKLKKCSQCNLYTLKDICQKCKEETKDAHYKFIKIRNAPNNPISIRGRPKKE